MQRRAQDKPQNARFLKSSQTSKPNTKKRINQCNKKTANRSKNQNKIRQRAVDEVKKGNSRTYDDEKDRYKLFSEFAMFIAEKNCRSFVNKIEVSIFYRKWQNRLRRRLLMKLRSGKQDRESTQQNLKITKNNENHFLQPEEAHPETKNIQKELYKPNKIEKATKKYNTPAENDDTLAFLIENLNNKGPCFVDETSSVSYNEEDADKYQDTYSYDSNQKRKGLFCDSYSDDIESLQSTGVDTLTVSEDVKPKSKVRRVKKIIYYSTTDDNNEEDEEEDWSFLLSPSTTNKEYSECEEDSSELITFTSETKSTVTDSKDYEEEEESYDDDNNEKTEDVDDDYDEEEDNDNNDEEKTEDIDDDEEEDNEDKTENIDEEESISNEKESIANEEEEEKKETDEKEEKEEIKDKGKVEKHEEEDFSYNINTDDISFSSTNDEPSNKIESVASYSNEHKKVSEYQSSEKLYDTDDIVITSTVNDSISTSEFRVPYSTTTTDAIYTSENYIGENDDYDDYDDYDENEEEETFQFSDSFEEIERIPIQKEQRATLPKPIPQQTRNRFKDPILASKDYLGQFAISSSEFSTDDDFRYMRKDDPIVTYKAKKPEKEEFNIFEQLSEEESSQPPILREENIGEDIDDSFDDSFDILSDEDF